MFLIQVPYLGSLFEFYTWVPYLGFLHTDGKVSARLADYKYKTALFKTLENIEKNCFYLFDSFLLIAIIDIPKSIWLNIYKASN